MMKAASALAVVAAAAARGACAVQCLDASGSPVDWSVTMKLPEISGGAGPAADGLAFTYMDSSGGSSLALSSEPLTSSSIALAQTLGQIYGQAAQGPDADFTYAMYNDETPDGRTSESRGHSKGVIAFDGTSGFWLVQSTPRWPPVAADGYDFPDDETRYGQSYLCLSLATSSFEDVAAQLQLIYPLVYDSAVGSSAGENMQGVIAGSNHVRGSPYKQISDLSTIGGAKFTSFAKNSAWNSDLYEDFVAAELQDDLRVETWMNGRGKMASYCKPAKPYNVENVVTVNLGGNTFTETKDHSKWAISSSSTGFVCIGGINRQVSQAKRGGGTVCSNDSNLFAAFSAAIGSIESC